MSGHSLTFCCSVLRHSEYRYACVRVHMYAAHLWNQRESQTKKKREDRREKRDEEEESGRKGERVRERKTEREAKKIKAEREWMKKANG